MYFLLLAFFASISLKICNGCFATPGNDATPEVPVLPCSTCPDLPMTAAPGAVPGPGGFNTGTGNVANSMIAPGCRQYVVTCDENPNMTGGMAVIIGANMAAISLSPGGPGEKMATLVCNEMGQIEGRTAANDPVIVTSVYCSIENAPAGK